MIEAVTLTVCALLAGAVQAQTKSWGWRGDGTGLFPDANPPVAWGRVSATLKDLTTQAEKPKGDEPGKNPAVLGNIPEWLVLGPIPYDAETSRKELLAKEFVPDEAKLAPAAGDKAGGVEWKKVSSTGAQLNLAGHYKDMSAKVFYAHAYIHSKNGGRVMLRLMGPTCQFRLNGQEVLSMEEANLRHMDKEVELKKGWNSLLVKVFTTRRKDYWALANNSPPDSGFFQVVLWGLSPGEQYESQGILWEASIPNAWQFSCAQPVVVGSRVIISTDPSFLICFDKLTGKRLWASYCGHSESATAEERQAKPDLFRQIDPKAARIKELASTWTGTLEQQVEYHDLAVSLARLMAQVDGKKYASASPAKSAGSGGLTSRTDGNFVYTWFSDGVSVCHDLDGKRKWMALENDGWPFSGGAPYITSPILTDREFVVAMKHTYAHDRETGKLLWTMPSKNYVWPPLNSAEPITAPGTPCINYELLGLYKPGVGWFPWSNATFAGNKAYVINHVYAHGGTAATEFTIPDTVTADTKLQGRNLIHREDEWSLLTLGSWSASGVTASVLVHDGLIYTVAMGGPFRVYDQKTLELVYSVRLDMNTIMFGYPYPHGSGVCASPALGGKNIYIFGNGGHSMVVKPGRKCELVAENRVECLMPGRYRGGYPPIPSNEGAHPECTVSSPIFDGDRIYLQGEGFLYCIGGN